MPLAFLPRSPAKCRHDVINHLPLSHHRPLFDLCDDDPAQLANQVSATDLPSIPFTLLGPLPSCYVVGLAGKEEFSLLAAPPLVLAACQYLVRTSPADSYPEEDISGCSSTVLPRALSYQHDRLKHMIQPP